MNKDDAYIRRPILVLGIGNILLHDEGVGVYVVEQMQKEGVADYVELLDGGTSGADLLDHICDRQKVIVIDSVDADVEPGTILRFASENMKSNASQSISLHEFGIAETIDMAKQLNCAPRQVVIIGIKPKDLNPGVGLSGEMREVIPRVVKAVLAEINAVPESSTII
jgi:hydrogenase maturation protease